MMSDFQSSVKAIEIKFEFRHANRTKKHLLKKNHVKVCQDNALLIFFLMLTINLKIVYSCYYYHNKCDYIYIH